MDNEIDAEDSYIIEIIQFLKSNSESKHDLKSDSDKLDSIAKSI